MTNVHAGPMRSLRHEVFALALMASVPVALALVFPYEAVSFRPSGGSGAPRAVCAFVTLGEDEERAALAAARTAWQVDSKSVTGLRLDLTAGDLPPSPSGKVAVRRRERGTSAAPAEFVPAMLPPTFAAPAPAAIGAEGDAASEKAPAFSRDDLLKID